MVYQGFSGKSDGILLADFGLGRGVNRADAFASSFLPLYAAR
jgi:hypothetical protein